MSIKILGLFIILSMPFFGITQDQKSETGTEPKSTFVLTINGKQYEVAEGEELNLDTMLRPRISIKLSEMKKFENSTFSFQYPRNLSYEFSQDFGYKNWTLTGNSVIVLMFELDAKTTVAELVEEMTKKFGRKNCRIENFQKKVGGRNLEGQKMYITLAGQKLTMECLEIKSSDFKSRFIYFQDSIEDDKNSTEYDKVTSIINSSIIYK